MDRRAFICTTAGGALLGATRLPARDQLSELIGESPAIERVRQTIRTLVRPGGHPPSVVLAGEAGSGKGLVADLLARLGRPGHSPVALYLPVIPDHLLSSLLQESKGGTLVLDEVDQLPPVGQLRLLEELGPLTADTWIISTIRDPEEAIRCGWLRDDLYRRLAAVFIEMPPLRDRGRDVLILAERLIAGFCLHYGRPSMSLTSDAKEQLMAYVWPGNVRELSHRIERAVLLADGSRITAALLELPG